MDFGSSHVYAGSAYYSEVPREETVNSYTPSQNETLYEAVELRPAANDDNHVYDPVASEHDIPQRMYDLVPYEPNLDQTSSAPSHPKNPQPKRSLSSAMFHKAKMVAKIKTKKKKPSRSTGSVSEVGETPPPLPPPRSILNKPLPPIPQTSSGPPLPPKPPSLSGAPLATTNDYEEEELVSMLTSSSIKESPSATPHNPVKSSTKPLYPTLPNVYTDFENDFGFSSANSTAPPSNTVMDQDIDLIDFDAQAVIHTPESNTEKVQDNVAVMTPSAIPSAPALSASMVKRETREKKKPNSSFAAADTNVVSVKMSILEKMENSMVWAMPPARCATCQAVILHLAFQSSQDSDLCRFCGAELGEVQQEVLPLVGNESDITYILNQPTLAVNDDPIVVFCIDTSGSMCVTSEVQSLNGHFMSRLQAVKDGIAMQLNRLRQVVPKCRIAIVTFSDTVVSFGDGSPQQYLYLNDAQLFDTDYIKTVATQMALPGFLANTHEQLLKTVHLLKDHGGTALGPALFLSVALAARKSGSQVIVCTDGRANVGVGSLELESDYKMCHNFYKETSDFGKRNGTMVSILSIEGTDCRLVELGKVADQTAGKVKIGSVLKISEEFQDILSSSLMATQVEVKLATQNELFFNDSSKECNSVVSKFIGNITRNSEITFKYGVKEAFQMSPPKDALFQLQVKFQIRNGCTCLRVITQSRPVTENRILAEQGLNPAVVGTYASQLTSKLVLDGELRDAKLTADAHKNLINRALSIRSTATEKCIDDEEERIYGSVCANIDELNHEIKKVVESVKPSESPSNQSGPPQLPPRPSETPSTLSRSSSMSSITFPEVPNNPLATKQEQVEAVGHVADEVARKLYKHRNACQGMFTAC